MNSSEGLIAHWPLEKDARDVSEASLSATTQGVTFGKVDGRAAGQFNGSESRIEVPGEALPRLGDGEFSIALWIHCSGDDIVGDLVNKFDHDTRRGFNLLVQTQTGMTQTTQSNYRHLQFGIDHSQIEDGWTDCGRPGNAVKVSSMASIEGELYVGTFENAAGHTGHLMRYCGGQQWQDLALHHRVVTALGRFATTRAACMLRPVATTPTALCWAMLSTGGQVAMSTALKMAGGLTAAFLARREQPLTMLRIATTMHTRTRPTKRFA